jgi:very-short-patch-repair endonuclease
MSRPKPLSKGEEAFALHCRVDGLNPIREHAFHPSRKWQLDFFFPERKIGVEIEGGTWQLGRHQRPGGFKADCEKYNAAALMGITILRYTTDMVLSGEAINQVNDVLKG